MNISWPHGRAIGTAHAHHYAYHVLTCHPSMTSGLTTISASPFRLPQMAGLATTTVHLAICLVLPLEVPCTTILTVLNHHFHTLPNTVMFLLISSNRVKFLHISYCPAPLLALSEHSFSGPTLISGHW